MPTPSQEELFSGLDGVPWDRIVHFHGRATDIPRALRGLTSGEPEVRGAARKRLFNVLEHQDGVCQATPLAAPFLVRLIASPYVEEKGALVELLGVLLDAARFQLGERPRAPLLDLHALASADKQWPELVSEAVDEMLGEEWAPTESDWLSWAALTEHAIVEARGALRRLADETPRMEAAATLLGRIGLPEDR